MSFIFHPLEITHFFRATSSGGEFAKAQPLEIKMARATEALIDAAEIFVIISTQNVVVVW